ncbi:MAG: hypothetical protein WBG37_12945 [Desulfobacterales bacterium]
MTPLLDTPELNVPENLRGTFRRMLYRIPREIRDDPAIQQKLLTFLKMGNETTARQFIAIQKVKLIDQLTIIQRHARDVVEEDTDSDVEDDESDDLDGSGATDPNGEDTAVKSLDLEKSAPQDHDAGFPPEPPADTATSENMPPEKGGDPKHDSPACQDPKPEPEHHPEPEADSKSTPEP